MTRPTFESRSGAVMLAEKIRRRAHIGIADKNQRMSGKPLELNERGDFAVVGEWFNADDELSVVKGII